jgi:hypothetical protein
VSTEPKVKVKISQEKDLVVRNGVVPFIVSFSVNTPKAEYPMMMKVIIDDAMQPDLTGSTSSTLEAHFVLP